MGMYNNMVGRVVGNSSGAKALGMMGPTAARVVKGAQKAEARFAGIYGSKRGVAEKMALKGMKAAGAVAAHPMRSIGAAGAGVGAMGAAGYGMHRRKGSQNYPMY
jgi:hypothetical protein